MRSFVLEALINLREFRPLVQDCFEIREQQPKPDAIPPLDEESALVVKLQKKTWKSPSRSFEIHSYSILRAGIQKTQQRTEGRFAIHIGHIEDNPPDNANT